MLRDQDITQETSGTTVTPQELQDMDNSILTAYRDHYANAYLNMRASQRAYYHQHKDDKVKQWRINGAVRLLEANGYTVTKTPPAEDQSHEQA